MTVDPDPVAELAEAVAADLQRGTPPKFDPATLLLLIKVLTVVIPALVNLIRSCRKTPAEAQAEARNPGLITRVRMHRAVRRHWPAGGLDGVSRDGVVSSLLRNFSRHPAPAAVFAAVPEATEQD